MLLVLRRVGFAALRGLGPRFAPVTARTAFLAADTAFAALVLVRPADLGRPALAALLPRVAADFARVAPARAERALERAVPAFARPPAFAPARFVLDVAALARVPDLGRPGPRPLAAFAGLRPRFAAAVLTFGRPRIAPARLPPPVLPISPDSVPEPPWSSSSISSD